MAGKWLEELSSSFSLSLSSFDELAQKSSSSNILHDSMLLLTQDESSSWKYVTQSEIEDEIDQSLLGQPISRLARSS